MLPKWKLILTNWINCYFKNTNIKDLPVNLESLLDIISHLRENLNLDESKSSLLDAHTVQEFILEKYPDFKFENGTIEPDSEGDVYLVASLLLFFVCVNSKNVDMKTAMCSKLSPEDQEIILKFSKNLMLCSKITVIDLQAAITEACGQDIAAAEPRSLRVSVVETPPALRSYHSEVRRLQAALDAERFDRTYLQDELTRTNMKVEKLLKDKEQYKLEIVSLKSQILLCCGQERESRGEHVEGNNISKLVRQLEQIEEKLLTAQDQLEDAQKERETYKTKMSQLKSEHDNLLAFCRQESARASGLAEELEVERRHTHTLRELVAEIRQHNHLNRMDSSLVECDDPDASISSLQHNSSACSEVCANVIEVQLVEERAKIVALKQQIQMLQDQLCEITSKSEEEKNSLTQIISINETTIMELKHRVNEEIDEKNTLKTIFDDDVAKLNNELNELEQRLKGTQENSRHIIEKKMQEIQNLQEQKLSLLQSLSDETTKSENIIKHLKGEIDAEKSSKIRLRDDYDSHIMKLNEKVLNRNNELVELQNKILEKGEMIETLQLELRKEKELKEELSNKCNNDIMHLNSVRGQIEQDLKQKSEEARDLHKHLQQHIAFIEQINKDNDHLRAGILQLQGDCKILKDSKEKLLAEVKNRDVKAEQIYKETENLKNLLCEEQQKLRYNMEETSSTIKTLQAQLQKESQEVSRLKEDLQIKADQIEKLSEEKTDLITLLAKYKNDIAILEEKNNEWKIKKDLCEVEFTSKIVTVKKELTDEKENCSKLESLLEESQATVKDLNDRIADLNKHNSDLELEKNDFITKLEEIKVELETTARMANEEHTKIKNENMKLLELLDVQKSENTNLQSLLAHEKQQNTILQQNHNKEKLILTSNYSVLQDCHSKAEQELESKQREIEMLTLVIDDITKKSERNLKDKDLLMDQLRQEQDECISKLSKQLFEEKENWLKDSELKAGAVEKLTRELEEVRKRENDTVTLLRIENEELKKSLDLKQSQINILEERINECKIKQDSSEVEYTDEILKLKKELMDKLQEYEVTVKRLNDRIADLNKQNADLVFEKHELDKNLEEMNTKLEVATQMAKDEFAKMKHDNHHLLDLLEVQKSEIVKLELLLNEEKQQNNNLQQDYNNEKLHFTNKCSFLEEYQSQTQQDLDNRQKEIDSLNVKVKELTETFDTNMRDKDVVTYQLRQEKDELISKLNEQLDGERKHWVKESASKADVVNKLTQELEEVMRRETETVKVLRVENEELKKSLTQKESEIVKLNSLLLEEKQQNNNLQQDYDIEKVNFSNKCRLLEEYQSQTQQDLDNRQKEIESLNVKVKELTETFDTNMRDKDVVTYQLRQEKDELISKLNEQLEGERKDWAKESVSKADIVNKLTQELEELARRETKTVKVLRVENEKLKKSLAQKESQIMKLELLLNEEKQQNNNLQQEYNNEKLHFTSKCRFLEEYQSKAQLDLENRQKEIESLNVKVKELTETFDTNMRDRDVVMYQLRQEKDELISKLNEQLEGERKHWVKESESKANVVDKLTQELEEVMRRETETVKVLRIENEELKNSLAQKESDINTLEEKNYEWKVKQDLREVEFTNELCKLKKELTNKLEDHNKLQSLLQVSQVTIKTLDDRIADLVKQNAHLESANKDLNSKLDEMNIKLKLTMQMASEEQNKIRNENKNLLQLMEAQKSEILKLGLLLEQEKQQNTLLQLDNNNEKLNLTNKCSSLQEYQVKAQQDLESRQKEVQLLTVKLKEMTEQSVKSVRDKDVEMEQLRQEKDALISKVSEKLVEEKEKWIKDSESNADTVNKLTEKLEEVTRGQADTVKHLRKENEAFKKSLALKESYICTLEEKSNEWKIKQDSLKRELTDEILTLKKDSMDKSTDINKLESVLEDHQATIKTLKDHIDDLNKLNDNLESEKNDLISKLGEFETKLEIKTQVESEELSKMKDENQRLLELVEVQKSEIIKFESLLMYEKQQNNLTKHDNNNERLSLINKCSILQDDLLKAQEELESKVQEIELLNAKLKELAEQFAKNLRDKDILMDQVGQEKDSLVSKLSEELVVERENLAKESELRADAVNKLAKKLEEVTRSETDTVKLLRKENEILKKSLALKDSFAAAAQERSNCKSCSQGADGRDQHHQVDTTPTEHTQSSFESFKTISDLEKILQDRNRTIRSLQSDITDLKSLVAESENKLLDVSNELEISKENCQQLSSQLKKIVHQKNEEIAELKKQLTKMSVTENRATQIIKVSAKYQAIILKRIAEIKSNTVLKELTNFGNTTNCDNDLRRGLNARNITMEDLENFLDTTDRHLKRFSEKQLALQKERDRLAEVNKINESELINMRKFLTEVSVGVKTFNSVKELYTQKLSRVVSLQRTVRRELLSLEGKVTDATMCKLERGYAAVMQDLSECTMNLERWVERTIGRVISVEKIKQAFSTEERTSVASTTVQNAGLEVQLEELENSFCKLLEEIARAQKGEGAKDAQAVTVMEVRAEYEDKLNRMKAKMKQLYHEQIEIAKEKQREEIASLERQLQKATDKLEESSRAYEEHIRSLTTELWNVGEKFLMKKDEAEWLRRKQRSGSLMSLQHVHSSGLVPTQEEPSRPSDTHSLRSLPVASNNNKSEGRTLHMSDEEGEVFDNRCLKELATTPARVGGASNRRATRDAPSAQDGPPTHRLSELQWRNSLCPPHLKSSYPAETQFVSAIHEEDIKCVGGPSMSLGGRGQRKEVGITAYKKPGPPTPSKQAGRLSATDSELRESLRVETEPNASRKTGTPSRIRALFRSAKGDNEGTPRSRRLSNIFRKK